MPRWQRPRTARSWRFAFRPSPISAPISRPSPPRCRPTSKRRCCPASTTYRLSIGTAYLCAPLLSGKSDIPAIYCEVDGVYTNTAPVDAYRGAGRPEATFVVERLVEVAAREMGRDPAEFRLHNFIRSFPHQTPVIMT